MILKIYNKLLKAYGPQGWWPLTGHDGVNPTKAGSINGYHPNDYSFPKNDSERFEICVGAILAQNTNWQNVEKSLINLKNNKLLNAKKIIDNGQLVKECIKPSGYFNIKAKYLRNFSEFYIALNGELPLREDLLSIKGIGKETADSILLYAYNEPSFVIDAYTRRIAKNLGLSDNLDYDYLKALFENNLPKDYKIFQEYHALLVEHAKRYYIKKNGKDDFLLQ